jgi:ABC-2 type transport system permease protein
MWERIREIIRKEFRQVLREPRMRIMLFMPPLIQLTIFGYAVNLDVENSRIAWMDRDRTPESRELLAAFQGSRHFQVTATPATDKEVQDLLDFSRVQAVVRVIPGFGRKIHRGQTATVQVLVDGTNSNTASIVSSYANRTVAAYGNRVLAEQQKIRLMARAGATGGPVNTDVPVLKMQSRVWFNEDLLSRNYFVPGVVVNIIALVTLMLTAMAIVREKEIGTMEQLMVTPIRPMELMLGKTLPFALIGLLDVVLITAAALLIFHIPFRGSGLLLLGSAVLFLLAAALLIFHIPFRGSGLLLLGSAVLFLLSTLGIGLFISTVSHTQQQAMMGSFFFFMPAFMLSGFAFPIRNMPEPVQYLTYLDPVRYFLEIVRGIFLKGTGADVLWPQMLALLIFGVTILTLSALRFHKRLD